MRKVIITSNVLSASYCRYWSRRTRPNAYRTNAVFRFFSEAHSSAPCALPAPGAMNGGVSRSMPSTAGTWSAWNSGPKLSARGIKRAWVPSPTATGRGLATEHVVVGCGEQLDTRVVSLHVVWVIVKDVDNAAARRFGLCLNTLDDLFVCLAYRITDVEVQYDGIFRSLTRYRA